MSNYITDLVTKTSPDINEHRLEELRDLFPEAFTEGKIDFDKLRATLGDIVDDRPDRYSFTWAGKKDAIRLLQTTTSATLVPDPDESINFQETKNIFIEGENLEVLKLLYKSYFGRVKMIYIDPPYNTGHDFIYPDDYREPLKPYLVMTGQMDENGELLTSNPETAGRYHSAWLSMMYPRLFIARQLLRDDGVVFVSIDDHEVHNLRLLMNEIFGEEQFVADVTVVNNLKGRSDRRNIATAHEHLLVYAKTEFESYGLPLSEDKLAEYSELDERGRRFQWRDLRKRGGADTRAERPNLYFPLYLNPGNDTLSMEPVDEHHIAIYPKKSDGSDGCWRWGKKRVARHIHEMKAKPAPTGDRWNVSYRIYLRVDGEERTSKPKSVWFGSQHSTDLAQRAFKKLFPKTNVDLTPKPVGMLKEIIYQSTRGNDICLDLFAGSCTMAQAVYEVNEEDGGARRFIMVQLPEEIEISSFTTLADLGKERIRRVIRRLEQQKDERLISQDAFDDALGFRVFKLTPSTFRSWSGTADPTPEEYINEMELFTDPIAAGARPTAVLWEMAIKEGYPLSSDIQETHVGNNTVFCVTDDDTDREYYICLDKEVPADLAHELGLTEDDLFVVRDIALDDTEAANLALQCRLKTI